MGRNGQNRRGLDLGTNAGSNASAGMAGAGGGGSGGGSGGRAVLAGGVGGSRSAGSGRGDDDDEDVGDIGNGAVLESGNGSGRRWLPSKSIILPSSTFGRFCDLEEIGYIADRNTPCVDFDMVDSEIDLNSSPSSNRTASTFSFSSAETPEPGS